MFVVSPLMTGPLAQVLRDCISTLLLLAGVYAAAQSRVATITCAILTGSAIIAIWASRLVPGQSPVLSAVPFLLMVAALLVVAITMVRYVLTAERVTFNLISAGLCIYLLIGVIWAFLFALIQLIQAEQDPFGLTATLGEEIISNPHDAMPVFSYFSFVTMTTLGYGDIVPATRLARSFATLEAVVGQLYLAVFVASLVGLHISHRREQRSPG
jgi:hypothetical protein